MLDHGRNTMGPQPEYSEVLARIYQDPSLYVVESNQNEKSQ